jgi:hypothetical protein
VTIMLRIPSRLTRIAPLFAVILAAPAGFAMAQQSTAPQSTPNQAPPKLENVEPGSDVPALNIPPKRGTQIEEKRADGGQVTEVDVTAGGSHYTMKPNNLPGSAGQRDRQPGPRPDLDREDLRYDGQTARHKRNRPECPDCRRAAAATAAGKRVREMK